MKIAFKVTHLLYIMIVYCSYVYMYIGYELHTVNNCVYMSGSMDIIVSTCSDSHNNRERKKYLVISVISSWGVYIII